MNKVSPVPPVESLPFESLMVRVPHHDPELAERAGRTTKRPVCNRGNESPGHAARAASEPRGESQWYGVKELSIGSIPEHRR